MPVGHARLLKTTAPGCTLTAGPWRALYVWKGGYSLDGPSASPEKVSDGTGNALGRISADLQELQAGSAAFIWEITGDGVDPPDVPRGTEMLAHYDMPLLSEDETAGEATLRFERVDLFPAVVTPRHTHRGSGLRVLISGDLVAELDERIFRLRTQRRSFGFSCCRRPASNRIHSSSSTRVSPTVRNPPPTVVSMKRGSFYDSLLRNPFVAVADGRRVDRRCADRQWRNDALRCPWRKLPRLAGCDPQPR